MASTRSRLEIQGVAGVSDRTLADIQSGLRFSPALCALGVATGTLLASPPVLLGMMATATLGAATPRHPFDWLYNYGVRHLFGKPAIPRNAAPRRFACGVGAAWLLVTAAAFVMGFAVAGYVLGAAMTAMAAFVAATHICVPSLVYTRLFGRVGDVPRVSVRDAFDRLRDGAVVLDIRDPEFWAAGHITGALHADPNRLEAVRPQLGPESAVLVVCQGGIASLQTAKALRDAGYQGACSIDGGMAAWLRAGLPLTAQAGG